MNNCKEGHGGDLGTVSTPMWPDNREYKDRGRLSIACEGISRQLRAEF